PPLSRSRSSVSVFLCLRLLPSSTLFPYTTLFRSGWVPGLLHRRPWRADHLGRLLRCGDPGGGGAESGRGPDAVHPRRGRGPVRRDRKSTRLNSSHVKISYAVFCLKKKKEIKDVNA